MTIEEIKVSNYFLGEKYARDKEIDGIKSLYAIVKGCVCVVEDFEPYATLPEPVKLLLLAIEGYLRLYDRVIKNGDSESVDVEGVMALHKNRLGISKHFHDCLAVYASATGTMTESIGLSDLFNAFDKIKRNEYGGIYNLTHVLTYKDMAL